MKNFDGEWNVTEVYHYLKMSNKKKDWLAVSYTYLEKVGCIRHSGNTIISFV